MAIENSIFALALPRNVPLTGEASIGSLEAATAGARPAQHLCCYRIKWRDLEFNLDTGDALRAEGQCKPLL